MKTTSPIPGVKLIYKGPSLSKQFPVISSELERLNKLADFIENEIMAIDKRNPRMRVRVKELAARLAVIKSQAAQMITEATQNA